MLTPDGQVNFRRMLLAAYTIRLDGRTRFQLTDDKEITDLRKPSPNATQALFVNRTARLKVRDFLLRAFPGQHLVIDATSGRNLQFRLSPIAPPSEEIEQALSEAARTFHDGANLLANLSDGVRAYTGLLAAVVSVPHRIILIDEPEAFLHPPLARRLGQQLASVASERGASLVVSTHSANFLLGCVESGVPTQVVRLTYEGGVPTARAIGPPNWLPSSWTP